MRTEMNLAHTPLGEVAEIAKGNQHRVSTQGLHLYKQKKEQDNSWSGKRVNVENLLKSYEP